MKKKKSEAKTNAMRELEDAGILYKPYWYETGDAAPSGVEAAARMGVAKEKVFKTLVTAGKSGEHHVFVIPAAEELDLKKAAAAAGEKSVEMIPQKELFGRTGYVHGGCSPLAMKKRFPTIIDSSAKGLETFLVSGGRVGLSIELDPKELAAHLKAPFSAVTR